MDLGRRGSIRGSTDLNGGGAVRSRGEMLILVCVLKRKMPVLVSNVSVNEDISYQSIRSRLRQAAIFVRG